LQQITRDHSFSQELLDAGMISEDEARVLPAKNLVTRAVGASPVLEPEVHDYDLESGDILLMCSDGLTEMVDNADIGELVGANLGDIAQVARHLVDRANEAGGRDNISVILVRVDGTFASPSTGPSEFADIDLEELKELGVATGSAQLAETESVHEPAAEPVEAAAPAPAKERERQPAFAESEAGKE